MRSANILLSSKRNFNITLSSKYYSDGKLCSCNTVDLGEFSGDGRSSSSDFLESAVIKCLSNRGLIIRVERWNGKQEGMVITAQDTIYPTIQRSYLVKVLGRNYPTKESKKRMALWMKQKEEWESNSTNFLIYLRDRPSDDWDTEKRIVRDLDHREALVERYDDWGFESCKEENALYKVVKQNDPDSVVFFK